MFTVMDSRFVFTGITFVGKASGAGKRNPGAMDVSVGSGIAMDWFLGKRA
jgi:hypothetical protein